MLSADVRARREAVVREHMESENAHDFDTTIATFGHPRYELVATGDVVRASCAIAELLLVHHPAEHGRHPGALVEAERAGVVRRVDAEPDAVLAALPEAPERVARGAPRPRPACATGDA